MLNNIKIGPKLIGGFIVVALITLVIGMLGINNMAKLNQMVDTLYSNHLLGISHVKEANIALVYIGRTYRGMLLAQTTEERKNLEKALNDYDSQLRSEMEQVKKMATTDAGRELINKSINQYDAYFKQVQNFVTLINSQGINKIDQSVTDAMEAVKNQGTEIDNAMGEMSQMKEDLGKKMYEESSALYLSMRGILITCIIIASIIGILIGFFLSLSISNPLTKVVSNIQDMAKGEINQKLLMDRKDEIGVLAESMDKLVDTMKDLIVDDGGVVLDAAANKDLSMRLKKEYKGQFLKMKDNINRVIESLDRALNQVSEATEQVSSASQQISAGSQSLAQGANEQASSLEEVSSSLEEMSSMTKQNSDNANQAKNLAGEANNNAKTGTDAMMRMSQSINKIKESSDQTAKIVKTIDEIAMQTNLLALNAAVEAARAGEAGRGFAVVAEEVRNLAGRSAQAAKNTADMITESVKNADDGVKIATEVSQSFEVIVTSVKKVNDLIAEIAAASQEQSQGIDQVNTAVAQMDKVTQQNAANSEESASAAEELSSQAEELQSMVTQFKLTDSDKSKNVMQTINPLNHSEDFHGPKNGHKQALHAFGDNHNGNGHKLSQQKLLAGAKRVAPKKKIEVAVADPDELIPMDDDAIKEF